MTDTNFPGNLTGLHHVTAIASDPADNVAFYTDILGQRLVKKTVNFDDPTTYHLYYGDGDARPGSIMTFFPWPGARRGQTGSGQATKTAYAVPEGSLDFWRRRFEEHRVHQSDVAERFGEAALELADPDGLRLRLVETAGTATHSELEPLSAEQALRGFQGVTLTSPRPEATRDFLTQVLALEALGSDGEVERFAFPSGQVLDLEPGIGFGSGGAGTVHHIAFRVPDDDTELGWQAYLRAHGASVSPVMDRQYFHSIYFREPGGVLFEIATDPPGFTADEELASLGESLKLPAGLEDRRQEIETHLPAL
ncbi:MAG: ring-cleaving dioxygenase [Acidobacteriota bacterium]